MNKLIYIFICTLFFNLQLSSQEERPVNEEYHAIIIGINDYEDDSVPDLKEPAVHAAMLSNMLSAKYTFKPENVTLLLNAKINDITKAFFTLKNKLTENDNLLIFFSGQSNFDQTSEYGYWMPSNVEMEYEANILSNSEVRNFIKGMKAKHILLISDAVFAGNLLMTIRYSNSENNENGKNYPSREAMTNGMLYSAPDESVFYKYLFKRLNDNTKKRLSARSLFNIMEDAVINNGKNIPQFGVIQGVGDEGGQFIFVKKN